MPSPRHPLDPGVAALAERVAGELAQVPGVAAVVLGGSWARGAADRASDLDLGLYYRAGAPPSLAALGALARRLDERGEAAGVTGFGEWGPWVNGGAWLRIDGMPVDWLYRDLQRVEAVVADCLAGRVACDYYLGHPHGFHSHVYLGELAFARALHDPEGEIARLKRRIDPYPPPLRAALVRRYLFDARFMLELARKPATRGDVFHVAGCLFRVAAALVQVLFAANERWFLNEKGALAETEGMERRPAAFARRASAALAAPGSDAAALAASVSAMEALVGETEALCATD